MRKILQKKWENLLWNYNEIIHLLTVKEVCSRQGKNCLNIMEMQVERDYGQNEEKSQKKTKLL